MTQLSSRVLALALPLLLGSGCATTFSRAEDLAKEGKFLEAATLFERLAYAEPNNREVRDRLEHARFRALEQLLGQARGFRRRGDDSSANGKLESFLSYRQRWNQKLNGALESSLDDEVEQVDKQLRREVAQPAREGLALHAERSLNRVHALLEHEELAAVRQRMEAELQAGAQAVCERLQHEKVKPAVHWADLVQRYCEHWQLNAPNGPVLPETLTGLDFSGGLAGISGPHRELLQASIARSFEASPWYSSRSPRRVEALLEGDFSARTERQLARLSAPWMETVPYTATETQRESYQEPYTDDESYTYTCGNTTCTGTRSVTKYRTAYRDVSREVTRYRQEPRVFLYSATKVMADYSVRLAVRSPLETGRAPFVASRSDSLSRWDYDHEVTFVPANVYPSRSQLPAAERWLEDQMRTYEREVKSQLFAKWRASHCSAQVYSVDEAARCARGGVELPEPARNALKPLFGEDATLVFTLYPGPGGNSAPGAGNRKVEPARAPNVPRDG
jgi:hypothetical protein